MNEQPKFYSLDEVSVSFCNVPIRPAWGKGGSISIKPNAEDYVNTIGRGGDVVRSKTGDKSATVTITILQTSLFNKVLADIRRLDLETPNGAGAGSLNITVRDSLDVYSAPVSWIQKPPEAELGQEATDRAWDIFCPQLDHFPGGRPAIAP